MFLSFSALSKFTSFSSSHSIDNHCFPHIDSSQSICRANQLSGFCMRETLVVNWLKLLFSVWLVYILRLLSTHFMPLISFYTPWKHQKTSDLLMFLGGIERCQWHEMGYIFLLEKQFLKRFHTTWQCFKKITKSLLTLRKICQNTGFYWLVDSAQLKITCSKLELLEQGVKYVQS